MDRVDIFAPITKREKDPATGHLYVTGQMTGPGLDGDQQRMDADWLKTAVPDWFRVGNIREMHQAKAVGKAVELSEQGDGSWDIRVKVVDKDAIEKVENQVLTGFSIGVKQPQIIKRADAPNGAITGGRIIETSLVDAPCLQSCTFTVAKADTTDVLQPVEQPELHEGEPDVEKRDVPQAERDRAASNGQAMSDGSFPIKNESDLKNAIAAVGRAKNPAAAKAHIRQRAKALGLSNLIPDSWGSSSSSSKAELPDIAKADTPEVNAARQALAPLVQALQREIDGLAAGDLGEQFDISCLTSAIQSISSFLAHEVSEPSDSTSSAVYLAAQPDATKANQPDPAEEAPDMTETETRELFKTMLAEAIEELTKAAAPDATKTDDAPLWAEKAETPDLAKVVSDAVTKAVEPLQTGLAEVTQKVNALPAPGGPVVTRTTEQVQKSDTAEKREEYLRKSQDPTLRQDLREGFAALAAQLPG